MLQDVDGLIEFMYNFCIDISELENHGSLPGHHLRLMANLALFLKYNRHVQDNVEKIDFIGKLLRDYHSENCVVAILGFAL